MDVGLKKKLQPATTKGENDESKETPKNSKGNRPRPTGGGYAQGRRFLVDLLEGWVCLL